MLTVQSLEKSPVLKEGVPLQNIPVGLKNLLPCIKLLQSKQKPGVFGLYFPNINKIYVGQSKNVSWEISMYKTRQRTNVQINQLMAENQNNVFSFVFYQGDALADEKQRREIETLLIKQKPDITINSQSTPRFALIKPSVLANSDFLKTRVIEGSLAQYNLKYIGFKPPTDQGCVYLFLNPVTKNFYIGETQNFYEARVMGRHRVNFYAYYNREKTKTNINTDKTPKRVCADFVENGNLLLFTALKNLGNLTKTERVREESLYKKEALSLYGDRLYNLQNPISNPGAYTQTEQAKQQIRQAALTADITQDFTEYPCICEGKWYKNRAEASFAYGYKSKDGLKYKLANQNEVNFIWLKDTKGKKIPNDPVIQQKVEDFFNNLKPKHIRIIKRPPVN